MRYAELFELMKSFTAEQMAQDVTTCDVVGEFSPIQKVEYADKENDVLDLGHPYLVQV